MCRVKNNATRFRAPGNRTPLNIMKAYKIIKSNIHRKGLCAARNIKKGERIIEYKGKKITHKQADEDDKYGYDIT